LRVFVLQMLRPAVLTKTHSLLQVRFLPSI
jgi:hypothetical protein